MSWPSWYSKVWSRAGGSLDAVYAQVIHSLGSSRFFARGWGDLSLLNPDKFHHVLMKLEERPMMRIEWQPVQTGVHRGNVFQVFEGKFASPAIYGVPNLPERCQQGRVWLMRPARDSMHPTAGMQGCVVQLAATGEHRQERRVLLGKRLLPSGIGTLILESPFYGSRKPPGQRGSKLLCVADLIKLGATTILEAVCLIWMLRKAGVLNICVAGWSMGAIHACMVASLTRFPVATAAIMPPRSASTAYCDGALSNFVDFHALRTARDAHGVPVLDTVSEMFSRRPNYPNTPSLFEHLSQQDQAAVQAVVTGAAKGAAAQAAAPPAQAEDQTSSDVHAWATQQTEDSDWPGGSFDLEPRLPPLEAMDVQHAQVHHNKRSSAFLKSIPAASALTPQLQRFLSALSAVTVPLWRPKRGGQRAMQRRSLHSSSTRRRGSRGRPQRHLSVLRPIRGPSRGSRSPSSSHSLRQQPQTLMHLKNVLTALQQVSQLRMSRENSKVQGGRRRRKRNTAFARTPSAQVMLPPCTTVHRTTAGPGTFWDTMNALLIAEIRHHLDAPFFSQEPRDEKHSTATNAPTMSTSDSTKLAREDQSQLRSRRPLEEAVNALPSSRGVQQPQPAHSLAADGPRSELSKGISGLETPAGDEQLPPVAAYQRAIVKSMLRAAGIMATRWPPLTRNPTTSDSNTGSSSSSRISDSSEGINGSVTTEPPSTDALTLPGKGPVDSSSLLNMESHVLLQGKEQLEGNLPSIDAHVLHSKGQPQPSLTSIGADFPQGTGQPEGSLESESKHPHTHAAEHHQEAAHCQQAVDSHHSTARSTEHSPEAVHSHSHSHHRGHRHGHPRRHSGSGSASRTSAASGGDSLPGTSTSKEQLTSVTARYSKLLKKVVSGEYLLGESDELHSDDEGDAGSHSDGQAMSGATEASISQAGQELLLAITLEAYTDLSRYPRPQAPHAAVLVAAENDGYVSPHAVRAIHKHWTGSQLWRANGGHVSSFITLNSTFVRAVRDSLARLEATPLTHPHQQLDDQ